MFKMVHYIFEQTHSVEVLFSFKTISSFVNLMNTILVAKQFAYTHRRYTSVSSCDPYFTLRLFEFSSLAKWMGCVVLIQSPQIISVKSTFLPHSGVEYSAIMLNSNSGEGLLP